MSAEHEPTTNANEGCIPFRLTALELPDVELKIRMAAELIRENYPSMPAAEVDRAALRVVQGPLPEAAIVGSLPVHQAMVA